MHVRHKGPRAGQLQQECALQRRRESRAIKRASPRFFRCRYSATGQQGNKAPLAARANSSSWNVRPSPRQKSHRASVPNKRTIASHRLMHLRRYFCLFTHRRCSSELPAVASVICSEPMERPQFSRALHAVMHDRLLPWCLCLQIACC